MDDAIFIYRNRGDERFFDASTRRMQGGPDKVIVYVNGVLCAMDREARITIPVSRWKLAEIGLACFVAALKGNAVAPRGRKAEVIPEAEPEVFLEVPPDAMEPEPPEDPWDRLMKDMRDLSR